jgi:transcriptional regulator with XRE-family HTH domain
LVSSPSYKTAIGALVEARREAGQTQREVAAALKKPASFIAKIETGERRLDIVEFIALARVFGLDPSRLISQLSDQIGDTLEI